MRTHTKDFPPHLLVDHYSRMMAIKADLFEPRSEEERLAKWHRYGGPSRWQADGLSTDEIFEDVARDLEKRFRVLPKVESG